MRYRDELDPAQGLEGFDHGIEPPTLGLFLQFALQAFETLMLFVDGPHVLLKHDLLGGRRADHLGEPAQVCRTPIRLSLIADILAQQEGLESVLGGFQIADGVLTTLSPGFFGISEGATTQHRTRFLVR